VTSDQNVELTPAGAELTVKAKGRRYDLHSVMTANFKRAEQALRSLEEYFKISSDLAIATAVERLRYRTYTLERAVSITHDSLNRLDAATLYVLMDDCGTEEHFRKMAECLVSAGVHLVQLRAKRISDRNLIARARLLRELTRGTQTLFIMNDRPDLAVLSHADGVHVGQDELSVKDARTIVGSGSLVGVSTHSIEQARQAVMDGANYIGVGPTFPSATKHFDEFTGICLLRAVAAEIRLPAFAIGGIDSNNLSDVLSTGIARAAIGSAVMKAEDPQKAIERILEILSSSSPHPR
jgi:thiamine-phosphate pyrophosphorylase